jgi:1-acyl-sn-glycerol-3-phosphate acyltransferase
MTIALNIVRVLLAGVITTVAGTPMLCAIYANYLYGLFSARRGNPEQLNHSLAWNAWLAGTVAQRYWARPLLDLCSIRVKVDGSEPIDWSKSYVICANHASIFDILALVAVVPPPFRFVAKRELLKWPIIGWTLRPAGQIVVNRADHSGAVGKIHQEAARGIDGQVIFFVEGTRTRTGDLLPFKKGAFHFALDAGLPILPVAITGSFGVLAKVPWWRMHPGRDVGIVFGEPIALAQVSDEASRHDEVQRLLAETRDQIAAAMTASAAA